MYRHGDIFCAQCHRWIRKADILKKTHCDKKGIGKRCCNDCGYQVRLSTRHRAKGKAWRKGVAPERYEPSFVLMFPGGEWRQGAIKVDVLENIDKWEKLISKPLVSQTEHVS